MIEDITCPENLRDKIGKTYWQLSWQPLFRKNGDFRRKYILMVTANCSRAVQIVPCLPADRLAIEVHLFAVHSCCTVGLLCE